MTQEEVLESMVNHDPLYIVDCENFIYYVKQVYIEGYQIFSTDEEIQFILNDKDFYTSENKKTYAFFLFKDKEECQKIVDKYNNNPTNKKRAEDWNSVETQKQLLELREIVIEIDNIN